MSSLLMKAQFFFLGSLGRWWPRALEPSRIVALAFFCLITFILVLIWRRLKPMGAIERLSSLAWEASGIPTYVRSLPQLRLDMSSARRYQRPFSVAVLSLEGQELQAASHGRSGTNGNGAHSLSASEAIQLVFPLIGSVLQEALRGSDKVTYDGANNQYVIVFPETQGLESEQAVRRLSELLIKRSSMNVKTGLAQFPTDGLILEDLVSAARAKLDRPSVVEDSLPSSVTREIRTAIPQ
jgi:hypothetical protein